MNFSIIRSKNYKYAIREIRDPHHFNKFIFYELNSFQRNLTTWFITHVNQNIPQQFYTVFVMNGSRRIKTSKATFNTSKVEIRIKSLYTGHH